MEKIRPTLILMWWWLTSLMISNNSLDQPNELQKVKVLLQVHRKCYQELKYWVLLYLNAFQAHVACFKARGSCYSTSTTGNPQRKSGTVRYRGIPAAAQQDDGVVQSEQKISTSDYVLSEPACRYTAQPSLSFLISFRRQSSYSLLCWHLPHACRMIVALDNHLLKWNTFTCLFEEVPSPSCS